MPIAPLATYDSPSAAKALADHAILNEFYGLLPREPRRTPMRELISTVLSHRTTHDDEELAYDRMLEAFGDWAGVEAAPTTALAHAIRTTRWPDTQAPRIQEILRRIKAEAGDYTLDFLADWPTNKALAWLTDMPGIGLKTASLVLLFNFRKPLLPVDTHVHRVAQRVGMIGPKVSADKAHTVLLALLPADAEALFNFHKHNYWLGQHICFFTKPNCPACPLKSFCNYYLEHYGPADAAALAATPKKWEGKKQH
ncbi:endonuclease III [Hymenobacter busanensis]|uniref:Endonuclease III n=1 Tax=Hymenobacter busanensis TaxID=2607656 RepID=A0A7L5A3L8_9BACT|nr:endonuclease III [Hymenobacter busanensis]KAA9338421.1 endonuclease III [Hymenobacter busanensis]QHJ09152.1 endonuclease III [Hymenobacter busanensis]